MGSLILRGGDKKMQLVRGSVRVWLILGMYALLTLGPVLVLGGKSLYAVLTHHPDWISLCLPQGRRLGLLMNSLVIAAVTAALCSLIGGLSALRLWSRSARWASGMMLLSLPLAAMPVYIYALAWFTGADLFRSAFESFGLSTSPRAGMISVIILDTLAYTPLAAAFAWWSMRGIPPELIESARLTHADIPVLRHVVMPLAAPSLGCAGALIFQISLLDYSVPSLLQVQVYPLEIFAEFSASSQPERAFLLALPITAAATLVLILLLKPLQSFVVNAVCHTDAWRVPAAWPAWFSDLLTLGTGFWMISLCLPIGVILPALGSPIQVIGSWIDARAEVGVSLRTAWLNMLISLPLGAIVAQVLLSKGRFSWIPWLLVLAPLAIPAALIGIGLVPFSQVLRIDPLNRLPSVLACMARGVPFAILIFVAQFRRNDPLLIDAVRVLQASAYRRLVWVRLPLVAAGSLAAAGLIFALSLGEFAATLLVIPPGQSTVSLRLYNYLHYGAGEVVAGLSLLMVVLVLASMLLAIAFAWTAWRRYDTSGGRQ